MTKSLSLSIVIPVYNGAKTIEPLVDELLSELGDEETVQIVLVNDDSPSDDSRQVCQRLAREKHKDAVTFIDLAKNFGEHNAVMAGLHYALGDYVVIMDDDFQNPPQEVIKLLRGAKENDWDVTYGNFVEKNHSLWRNLGSWFNGKVANLLLRKPPDLYLSSFKCLSAFIVSEIRKYEGPHPYIDGLALRSTSRIGSVDVLHEQRRDGSSGYTFRKLVRLWLNMFLNFSVTPLRASSLLGLVFAIIGLVMSISVVGEKLLYPNIQVGWASLMCAITVFSGVQLILLGLVGEYIGALFLSLNQTPQFVIRSREGLADDEGR